MEAGFVIYAENGPREVFGVSLGVRRGVRREEPKDRTGSWTGWLACGVYHGLIHTPLGTRTATAAMPTDLSNNSYFRIKLVRASK